MFLNIGSLRNFDATTSDTDALVSAYVALRNQRDGYEDLEEDTPSWVDAKIKAVRQELSRRKEDVLAEKLAKAKLARARLRTADEKRADLEKEIQELESKVNKA